MNKHDALIYTGIKRQHSTHIHAAECEDSSSQYVIINLFSHIMGGYYYYYLLIIIFRNIDIFINYIYTYIHDIIVKYTYIL